MKLWLAGRPFDRKPEEVKAAAREQLDGPPFASPGIAVRVRILFELPEGPLEVRPPLPVSPPVASVAWFLSYALEGVAWEDVGLIQSVHVSREWARIAGVEVRA